ncbi:hypothetical protein [Bradyrhizobium sp. SRS-191]|uniref:hypothetical protein n=1 Tax=Bradyrhizobium sp. SRS-191 TaxID=2962606 RepID=UPI00211DED43|nr:hypothetical protein [Bradyrhizobium sp. SRS-191]
MQAVASTTGSLAGSAAPMAWAAVANNNHEVTSAANRRAFPRRTILVRDEMDVSNAAVSRGVGKPDTGGRAMSFAKTIQPLHREGSPSREADAWAPPRRIALADN